jgi:hypothetical protein
VVLADEQEKRRRAAEFSPAAEATSIAVDEGPQLDAVLVELRAEMASLEAELHESVGDEPRISGR